MDATSSFKIFFVDDALQARSCMQRIKAFHSRLAVKAYSDIKDCILQIDPWIQNGDLLWLHFHFFDEMVMALPNAKISPIRSVFFVVDHNISGIALDILKMSDVTDNVSNVLFAQPYSTVVSGFYRGSEFKQRTKKFISHLMVKIQRLEILKSILPTKRDYFSLNELVDSCFNKLLDTLQAKSGVLNFSEKRTGKEIYLKEYGEEPLNKLGSHIPRPTQSKIAVRTIAEIAGESVSQEMRSLGVKTNISSLIPARLVKGYFAMNTVQEQVGQCEMALLEAFRTQLGIFLDNTLYFQDLLKMLNQDISLVGRQDEAVMIVDAKKRVIDINLTAEGLTGWNRKEALGRPCRELWQSCDYFGTPMCDTARCPMEKALRQGQGVVGKEVRTVKKSGEKRVVKSDYVLDLDNTGKIDHGVAIVRDVTERIKLQERFYRLEQMARLGDFASELAHEIRNPVTGISSSAQYLYESAEISEEHKKIVEEILIGAHVLEKTVKKYLGLAKHADPRLQRGELNDMITEIVRFLRNRMEQDGISVEVDLGQDLPALFVDVDQIRQVYLNVLLNAIEALPNGGKIAIKTALQIGGAGSVPPVGNRVVSIVSDSGQGVRSCDTDRIFDAFYTTKPSGSGLGLYTACNILQKHNATIQVFSEEGSGTQVIISFPVVTE